MGHSSVQVTLDRYGHLVPELDNAITVGARRGLPAVADGPPRGSRNGPGGHAEGTEDTKSPQNGGLSWYLTHNGGQRRSPL